jgi:hypothetical protein
MFKVNASRHFPLGSVKILVISVKKICWHGLSTALMENNIEDLTPLLRINNLLASEGDHEDTERPIQEHQRLAGGMGDPF